jgi:hypothetical protein
LARQGPTPHARAIKFPAFASPQRLKIFIANRRQFLHAADSIPYLRATLPRTPHRRPALARRGPRDRCVCALAISVDGNRTPHDGNIVRLNGLCGLLYRANGRPVEQPSRPKAARSLYEKLLRIIPSNLGRCRYTASLVDSRGSIGGMEPRRWVCRVAPDSRLSLSPLAFSLPGATGAQWRPNTAIVVPIQRTITMVTANCTFFTYSHLRR